jgi:hypothetical protein
VRKRGINRWQREAAVVLGVDLNSLKVTVPDNDVAMYTRGIEVDPQAAWAWFKRARAHSDANCSLQAAADFRQCAKLLEEFIGQQPDKRKPYL